MMSEEANEKGTEMSNINDKPRSDYTNRSTASTRKATILANLTASSIKAFLVNKWEARYNIIAGLPLELSADGVNTVALVNALILTIPYGIMSYINGDFFDQLQTDMASNCTDGLLNGNTFYQYHEETVSNIACLVYAPMISLCLVSIYYLAKDEDVEKRKKEEEERLEKKFKKIKYEKMEEEENNIIWDRILDKEKKGQRSEKQVDELWNKIEVSSKKLTSKDDKTEDGESKSGAETDPAGEDRAKRNTKRRERKKKIDYAKKKKEEDRMSKMEEELQYKGEEEAKGNKRCEDCQLYKDDKIFFQRTKIVNKGGQLGAATNFLKGKKSEKREIILSFDKCKDCRHEEKARLAKGKLFMMLLFILTVCAIICLLNTTALIIELYMPYNICKDNGFTNSVWKSGIFFVILSLPLGLWLAYGSNEKKKPDEDDDETFD